MRVQELALISRVEQRLMRMLPMNVEQQPAERLQVLKCDGLVVDECTRSTFIVDHAPQSARSSVIEAMLTQPHDRRVLFGAVEDHADFSAIGALPDRVRICSVAEGEPERVDEY